MFELGRYVSYGCLGIGLLMLLFESVRVGKDRWKYRDSPILRTSVRRDTLAFAGLWILASLAFAIVSA